MTSSSGMKLSPSTLFLAVFVVHQVHCFNSFDALLHSRPSNFVTRSWITHNIVSKAKLNQIIVPDVILSSSLKRTALNAEKETITFSAVFDLMSDTLPTTDENEAYTFCRSKHCRDHFLSAGGKSNVIEVEWSDALASKWRAAADKSYGIESLPNLTEGDCLVACTTSSSFPPLKLMNTAYCGVKILEDSNRVPIYKVYLVADKRTPVGPAPAVWIYNKLNGADSDDEFSPTNGNAITSVSVKKGNDGGYAIHFTCKIEIVLEFPKLLLKILPASKEKIEEQGSASIKKSIEKDINFALMTTKEAFHSWKSQSEALVFADT